MPGIAGIIGRELPADTRRSLQLMLGTMMHEPFYTCGTCCAPELGVYAGWVAHRGSFAATQSRGAPAGEVGLAFAGECFQDDQPPFGDDSSRATLPQDMRRRPESVILALYERCGCDSVAELNGMFSGLVVDRRQKRAMLFNDRYGLERVYVHETAGALYFASEAKALLRILPATRAFDDRAVAEFLAWGCPADGRTLFRGVNCLEPASVWVFDGTSSRRRAYFTPRQWEGQPPLSARAFESEFQDRFRACLPRYVQGAGIGISLTGGLDTRLIMAYAPRWAHRPVCYTFDGATGKTLDARVAGRVAAACGLEHTVLRIGQEFLTRFDSHVDRTVYVTDGCAGARGAHEIYLNAQARELSPIRVTGNFGSEVLRGVTTFKPLGLSPDLFATDFRREVDAAVPAWSDESEPTVTSAAFREIPWKQFGTMAAARSQVTFRTPYLDNALVSLAYRAPEGLRAASGPALRAVRGARPELAAIATDRNVLVDGRGSSYALKRLFAEVTFRLDYLHKEAMPRWMLPLERAIAPLETLGLLGLHKYLPYRLWFRKELAGYVRRAVRDAADAGLPYWNRAFLAKLADDHVRGRRNCVREIDAVVTLAAVERFLLAGSSRGEGRTPETGYHEAAVTECLRI